MNFTMNEKYKKVLDYVMIAVYAVITFLLVFKHEPWRDEAQSWLLVQNSSLWELLVHHIRYQQHPALWYLILFPFAKLSLPYFTQFVIHWAVAVAAVFIFVTKAPFERYLKYTFIFSFYMMHEYVLIARNYNIVILLLFLIAYLYPHRFKRPVLFGGLIALLFNSNYIVFTAAGALLCIFAYEGYRRVKINKELITGLSVAVIGGLIAFAYAFALPHDHYSYGASYSEPNFVNNVVAFGRAFIPLYWDVGQKGVWAVGVTAAALIIVYLIRKPTMLFLLAGSFSGLIYIFTFRYGGFLRHFGIILILILFILWVSTYYELKRPFKRGALLTRIFFIMLTMPLLLSVKYSIWANTMEIKGYFSGGKPMAEAIDLISKKLNMDNDIIVAHPATKTVSVAAYLPHRLFWHPEFQEFGTYWKDTHQLDRDESLAQTEIVIRAGKKFQDLSDTFFLLSKPLGFSQAFGYEFRLLHKIDRGVWGYGLERYYLYKPVLIRKNE